MKVDAGPEHDPGVQEKHMMRRRLVALVLSTGLVLVPLAGIGAQQKVAGTLGAFTENEINNAPYASGNLYLVPGLTASLRSLSVPIYGKLQFENRMKPSALAGDTYAGTELRHRYHVGGTLELLDGYVFNPEYEARLKNYVGSDFRDRGVWENRIHLSFLLRLNPSWDLVVRAMPTYILENNATDPRGGGTTSYSDFYSEPSLGPSWTIDSRNKLSLLVYEEMRLYEQFETAPGTLNNGGTFRMVEMQVRLIWAHKFRNGISIGPYARAGIFRHEYSRTGGTTVAADYRRDRVGLTLRYNAEEGGINPYMETYWQRQEQNGADPQHRFMFKMGFDYGLPSRSKISELRQLQGTGSDPDSGD